MSFDGPESLFKTRVSEYFAYLKSSYDRLQSILNECKIIYYTLTPIFRKYSHIRKASLLNTPLEDVQELVPKLLYNITQEYNHQTSLLSDKRNSIMDMQDELNIKLEAIHQSTEGLEPEELSIISPDLPHLSEIFEYCHDGLSFLLGMSAQITQVELPLLMDMTGGRTSNEEHLQFEAISLKRIQEILFFTKHICNQNNFF